MTKLDSLLLLESAELYCSNWDELKIKIMQLIVECTVNINNQHIMKLIQAVEALVINQKKLILATLIFYMIALKDMSVWSDLSIVCEVSMYFVRELMIACSNMFLQDWECFIKQIVKEINKLKDNIMSEKVLIIWRLLSNDILIITNTIEIKK